MINIIISDCLSISSGDKNLIKIGIIRLTCGSHVDKTHYKERDYIARVDGLHRPRHGISIYTNKYIHIARPVIGEAKKEKNKMCPSVCGYFPEWSSLEFHWILDIASREHFCKGLGMIYI